VAQLTSRLPAEDPRLVQTCRRIDCGWIERSCSARAVWDGNLRRRLPDHFFRAGYGPLVGVLWLQKRPAGSSIRPARQTPGWKRFCACLTVSTGRTKRSLVQIDGGIVSGTAIRRCGGPSLVVILTYVFVVVTTFGGSDLW